MMKQADLHLSRVYAVMILILAALAVSIWLLLQPLID